MNLLDEALNIELVITGVYTLITAETLVRNYLKNRAKEKYFATKEYFLGDLSETEY